MSMDEDAMRQRWLNSIPPEFRLQRPTTAKTLSRLRCVDCHKAFDKRSHDRRCQACQSHFDRTVHQRHLHLRGD
jgi:rRNA maturation endonuclease Nob1